MCKCTPAIKTPYCGRPGCEWPDKTKSKPKPKLKVGDRYEEIQGRDLYMVVEEDLDDKICALLTAGTPKDHQHIMLNDDECKSLCDWLDKYLKAKG